MNERLHCLDLNDLTALNPSSHQFTLKALEEGKVIYLPNYSFPFEISEPELLLDESILEGSHKNVGFDYRRQSFSGFKQNNSALALSLKSFMKRYAEFAKELVDTVLPQYKDALRWGRTSYRPAEIKDRNVSKRKDDTRLHVDSFPSSPVYGQRILRVFCNVNPEGKPRIWHLGEPFPKVAEHFSPKLPKYNLLRAKLLHLVKGTKTLRSAYDHYQIKLHDQMKLDDHYQQAVDKERIDFPASSSWIVFSDQVSHAALGGQYLLEQTFYLPVEAMANPDLSPLKYWQKEKAFA